MADAGFDVWLGNNRSAVTLLSVLLTWCCSGSKYGFKHVSCKPSSPAFWNFSIDEFARFDVPAGINYITGHTGAAGPTLHCCPTAAPGFKQLTYIGFSQGSAQAFACFSTLHDVAAKVNLFIALSPAAKAQVAQHTLHLLRLMPGRD